MDSCRIKKKVLFNPSTLKVIRDSATGKVMVGNDYPPCEWIYTEAEVYPGCAEIWWPSKADENGGYISKYMIAKIEGIKACAFDWITSKTYYPDWRCKNYYGGYYKYFRCKSYHVSSASTEPGVGVNWESVWELRIDNPTQPDLSDANGLFRLEYDYVYGGIWGAGCESGFRLTIFPPSYPSGPRFTFDEYPPYMMIHFDKTLTSYNCSDCFPIVFDNQYTICPESNELQIGKDGTVTLWPPKDCECE